MKRFASLVTAAALGGSLLCAKTPAQAQSVLYLVPISPLGATYFPGDVARCAAVVDLNTSSFASLTIPFALAWTDAEFGNASGGMDSIDNGTSPYVDGQPTQRDPNNTRQTVFDNFAQSYTTTASKINGNIVYTIQNTVGQKADSKGGVTLAFPAGTYTLGTFSFPISANNNSGSATIYLPTPYGYTNSANSADGAYNIGTGVLYGFLGKAPSGSSLFERVVFPSTTATLANGKYSSLTYHVTQPAYLYGVVDLGLASGAPPQPVTFVATSQKTHQSQTFVVPIGPVVGSFPQRQPNFTFSIAPDIYDVTIQGSKWLKRRVINVDAEYTYDYGIINVTLPGGDANGDNSVDSTDFGILIGAYNSSASLPGSGYDATADFNCDGVVDSTDFGILIGSFNEVGAP